MRLPAVDALPHAHADLAGAGLMDHVAVHAFIYTGLMLFGLAVLMVGGYMLYLLCRNEDS